MAQWGDILAIAYILNIKIDEAPMMPRAHRGCAGRLFSID